MNDKPNFDLALVYEQGLHETTKQALADALAEVESIKARVIELEGDLEDAYHDAIERGERE